MGIAPDVFWDMEIDDFFHAAAGFTEAQEAKEIRELSKMRWLAAALLMPHAKKGHKIKPKDLFLLPGEHDPQTAVSTLDKSEEFKEVYKRIDPKGARKNG